MTKIKTREIIKGTIKTLDKSQKTKESIVTIKNKSENATNSNEQNANVYAINKISNTSRVILDNSSNIKQKGNQSVKTTKDNFVKVKQKVSDVKIKLSEKRKTTNSRSKIKVNNNISNRAKQQTFTTSEKAMRLAKRTIKKSYDGVKKSVKISVSSIKAIIMGTKALIALLIAGGWIIFVIILLICMIGLLCSSFLGIFFSIGRTGDTDLSIQNVVAECNQELSSKIQQIQKTNPHDEYVLDGNVANWKDILMIYTIKQSNGKNDEEVVTMDPMKRQVLKNVFWDMNIISYEVKEELVMQQGVNSLEIPKEVMKKVLHVKIDSKTVEQMKIEYRFNPFQIQQLNELSSDDYAMLWNDVIYGTDSGEYVTWKQKNAPWSNIRIGNTNSTISDIGCLVTSVAILIKKSGVSTEGFDTFNPGTFVEKLNANGGFDDKGNLQYDPINKIVPGFKYVDKIYLKGKSREEKLSLITQYFNAGYHITVEVKGATAGNQHWVAITGIDGSNIMIVDPGSNHTVLWNAYEVEKTSQFNYFIAK